MKTCEFKAYPRYASLLAVCLLLSFNALFAQESLFRLLDQGAVRLDEGQQAALHRMLKSGEYTDAQLLDVAPLSVALQDRHLHLSIEGQKLSLPVRTVEYIDESNYYLYAEQDLLFPRQAPIVVRFQFRVQDGMRFGTLHFGESFYRIDDLGAGQTAIFKARPQSGSEIRPCGNILPSKSADQETLSMPDLPASSKIGGNCDVRVLIMFTPGLANNVANIATIAQSYIDQANQALANSGIPATTLRFVLAGAEETTSINLNNVPTADFVLNGLVNDLTIRARRIATDADLVSVISNFNEIQFGNDAALAFGGASGAPVAPLQAFSLIGFTSSLPNYVFPHEIGHNMGCGHEPADNTQAGVHKAHDWTYKTGILFLKWNVRRQTIMWSSANDKDVTLNYSNPAVIYHSGDPTGTLIQNNASILATNSCTVAAYLGEQNFLSIDIVGPDSACPYDIVCFDANIVGAPGPYTIQWSWTVSGVLYQIFGNGGTSACLDMLGINPPATVTIRLDVSAPGQPTRTSFHDVQLLPEGNNDRNCAELKNVSPRSQEVPSLHIAPQPADHSAEIQFHLDEETPVQAHIYDLSGRLIQAFPPVTLPAGTARHELDLSGIAAGIYILKVETNGRSLSQRLTVRH